MIQPNAVTPDSVFGVGAQQDRTAEEIILAGPPGTLRFARLDIKTGNVTIHLIDPGTHHPYNDLFVNNGQMATSSLNGYTLMATTAAYRPDPSPRRGDTVFQLFKLFNNNAVADMAQPRAVHFW